MRSDAADGTVRGDNKRLLASATDACAQLRKVLDARRLYERGHQTLSGFLAELQRRLQVHLQEHGELTLQVSSLSLLLGDKPVLSADRREESITHAMFLDGVRTLSFLPALDLDELTRLVELWHESLRPAAGDDQTFPARLWEAGLANVRVASVESLAERAEVDALVEELKSGRTPTRLTAAPPVPPPPPGGASAFEIDINARIEGVSAAISATVAEDEVHALVAELAQSRREAAERTLLALANLATGANADERARLTAAATRIFEALVRDGAFSEACTVIRNMVRQARPRRDPPPWAPALLAMLEQLDSADVVGPALTALANPARAEEAADLLAFLPLRAAPRLMDALDAAGDVAVRRRLVAILSMMLPGGALLEARVAEAAPATALDLLELARSLPSAESLAVRLRALRHSSPKVRRAALDALGAPAVQANLPLVRPLLNDPDAEVRRAARDVLVRLRDPQTAVLLGERLQREALDENETRIVFAALASLGGDAACLALRATFRTIKDPELKAACALALARAGDEYAIPVLEAAANKFFAPQAVREACREALRQLERRRASRAKEDGS